MPGNPAVPFAVSPYGSAFGTTTTITAQSSLKPPPSLKPKPSVSRLKPRGFLPSSSTLSPPPRSTFSRSKTEPTPSSIPSASKNTISTTPTTSTAVTASTGSSSIPQRKPSILSKAPPSSLPKPSMTSTIPPTVTPMKSKTSPPSKHYAAFSIGSTMSRAIPSVTPTGSSDKLEKKPRKVIRRKNSTTNSNSTFGLGSLRSGSTTSANGSTSSITSTSSYTGLSSRSGASVLGIPLPINISSSSLHHYTKSNASSSVPKILTHDLTPPISNNAGYSSSSSTQYYDSPSNFSLSSTPSSMSTPSPALPSSGFRARTQSPNRPPVTRNRSGSIGQILNELGDIKAKTDVTKGLHSVRESTTSTSSSSTVRGGNQDKEKSPPLSATPSPPLSTPSPPVVAASLNSIPPRMASPQVANRIHSPATHFGTFRSKSSNPVPTRPSREGTPDLHASGLGLTIPVIQSNLTAGPGHLKTRSKSTGTVGLGIKTTGTTQRKGSVPAATLPLPSPSFSPSTSGSRRPSITHIAAGPTPAGAITSPTVGFAYNSLPTGVAPRKRAESIERGGRDRSPTRASPGKNPRPGLFSRGRSKTSDQIEPRKGPAAGTGHEGYGNFGRHTRGRSGSNTSNSGSRGRSGSQSSVTSDSGFASGSGRRSGSRDSRIDMDDYFMDKLKPVVLAGGGEVVENQNFSSPEYRPRNGSNSGQGGFAMSRSGSENDGRRPGSRDGQAQPTIRTRRAATPIPAPINTSTYPFSHARTPPIAPSVKKPQEVKQSVINAHTKLEKACTPVLGQEAWANDLYTQISPPLATDPLPTTAPVKTKRWNLWQKSQSSTSKNSPAATIPVTGRRQARPAHYALLDPFEQEATQVKDLMLELRNKAKEKEPGQNPENNRAYTTAMRKQHHVHSMLLPEPPHPPQSTSPRPMSPPTTAPSPGVNMTPALSPLPLVHSPPLPPKNTLEIDMAEANRNEIRAAKANERKRLQQAGARLPGFGKKVDTTKQPASYVSPQVESIQARRPSESEIQSSKQTLGKLPLLQTQFSKAMRFGGPEGWSAPAHIGPGKHFEQTLAQQIASRNQNQQPTAKELQQQVDWSGYALKAKEAFSPVQDIYDPLDATSANMNTQEWPIRKDSIPAMPADILSQTTVINSESMKVSTAPFEEMEDVWTEYDDLLEDKHFFGRPFSLELELEDATTPRKSRAKSSTSSLGSPFQFDNLSEMYKAFMEDEIVIAHSTYARESPTLPNPNDIANPSISSGESSKTDSTVFELDESPIVQTAQFAAAPSAPPRIKIVPFNVEKEGQDKSQPPQTPFSMTKFLQYYTGAGLEENNDAGVLNAIDAVHHGAGSVKSRTSNGSSSSGGSRGSTFSELGLEDEMKLRLWGLMASTWLNFDRVLVSPAHEQLKGGSTKGKEKATETVPEDLEGRILVVDGLGTDEWSYYCALTYPKCTVYNLSPSLSSSETGSGSPTGLSKPPNHKQIHHTSFDTVFPFPVGFFNVVSLRFLPSQTYPSLPFILQQCQRVLAPGGYIEISTLDSDLFNMGNRTKRAVDLNRAIMIREFEETAANSVPGTVSCLSASTIAARPATERVLKLLEKGFEDVNRCIVMLPCVGHIDGSVSMGSVHGSLDLTHKQRQNGSDGVLSKPTDANDTNITNVVSKVGRWWYTRTYERVMTGEKGEAMGRSMWMDKGLLRECSKKKTGMRMLVAYARKASNARTEEKIPMMLVVPQDGIPTIPITPGVYPKPLEVKKTVNSGQHRRVAFQD